MKFNTDETRNNKQRLGDSAVLQPRKCYLVKHVEYKDIQKSLVQLAVFTSAVFGWKLLLNTLMACSLTVS